MAFELTVPVAAEGEDGWGVNNDKNFSDIKNKIDEIDSQMENKVNGHTISADTTVYVSKSGNDTTADGTTSKPFLTIQPALDYAALLFGNKAITVSIGDGIYEESLLLTGVRVVSLVSASGDASKTIIKPASGKNGIYIGCCNHVTIHSIGITKQPNDGTNAIIATLGRLMVYRCAIDGSGASNGVQVTQSGLAYVRECEIKNCASAVVAQSGTLICATHNTGAGNSIVFNSNVAIIMRTGTTPSGNTLDCKVNGGQIFS